MNCPKCKAKITVAGDRFCPVCRHSLYEDDFKLNNSSYKIKIIISAIFVTGVIIGIIVLAAFLYRVINNIESNSDDTDKNNLSVNSAPAENQSYSLTENKNNDISHLLIPDNTYEFIKENYSSIYRYSLADIDEDDEYELIVISKDYVVTFYEYDWITYLYTASGSFEGQTPGDTDVIVTGIKDGKYLYRIYDYNDETEIADIKDYYYDTKSRSYWGGYPSGTVEKTKQWYMRDYDEILLFEPDYDFTQGVVMTDLQSRKLTERYIDDLYEACGGASFKEKNVFLDDLVQELAALKGYIFEEGGEHLEYYLNCAWYNNKYYQPYESVKNDSLFIGQMKERHPEYGPLGAYNVDHYWNGDESKPSPLSNTYEEINSPLIQSMKS